MASDTFLDKLRSEIDRLDDDLHDTLMKRAEIVERIGGLKEDSRQMPLRPGREAEILRRIVARHGGGFPKPAVVRIWREMLSGMCAIQGRITAAVYAPEQGAGCLDLARGHYGVCTPVMPFRLASQVVRAVTEGSATIGVLPMPGMEDAESWWIGLMGDSPGLPRIITRLPFSGPGTGRGDETEALVVAGCFADSTGCDRSWIGVETVPDVSSGRLRSVLAAAGLEPTASVATRLFETSWRHLVEIAGPLDDGDPRLSRLLEAGDPVRRCVPLGGHPVPFDPEDLSA